MAKFKKGDRVRVINKAGESFAPVGHIGVLIEAPRGSGLGGNIYLDNFGGEGSCACFGDDIELISESPQYKPITPKVGEKYRVLKKMWGRGMSDFSEGDVIVISKSGFYSEYASTEYLELVEEPKERWLGKGMLESSGSAQQWVDAIKAHTESGLSFRNPYLGLCQESYVEVDEQPIKKTIIQKTMNLIKKLTQSAEDKTLEKSGFVNSCGELTSLGNEALLSLVFQEKKAELVELAEAVIADREDK